MTRVLLVLLLGFIPPAAPPAVAVLADPFETTASVVVQQQDPAAIRVYVTRTGDRYHRDGRGYVRQSKTANKSQRGGDGWLHALRRVSATVRHR